MESASTPSLPQTPPSQRRVLTKKQAFLGHLILSTTIVTLFSLVVFLVWYPYPYYLSEDSLIPLRILVGVDVVLGPLMTLILFRPGKKGLWFDMTCVAIMQTTAFIYGVMVIYAERPLYLAFAVDRFVVVAASQVELDTLKDPSLDNRWGVGPLPVFARLPDNPQERSQLMFQVLGGGKDVERLPQYYHPLAANMGEVLTHGTPLADLMKQQPKAQSEITELLAQHHTAPEEALFYPLKGGIRTMVMIVDRRRATLLGSVNAPPWEE